MPSSHTLSAPRQPSVLSAIFLTGIIAGSLDLAAAYLVYGIILGNTAFASMVQFIASGVFGNKAFAGGVDMLVYGLLFHYAIAVAFTAFFFFLCNHLVLLQHHTVIGGLLYGIFVWIVMNIVVLPRSNAPAAPFQWRNASIAMSILMVFVGLPIAIMASRYYFSREANDMEEEV